MTSVFSGQNLVMANARLISRLENSGTETMTLMLGRLVTVTSFNIEFELICVKIMVIEIVI